MAAGFTARWVGPFCYIEQNGKSVACMELHDHRFKGTGLTPSHFVKKVLEAINER